MDYRVLVTRDAAQDLERIYDYIAEHDLPKKADYVLGRLETTINGLCSSSARGRIPKELLTLGIREYRKVFMWRTIHRRNRSRFYPGPCSEYVALCNEAQRRKIC